MNKLFKKIIPKIVMGGLIVKEINMSFTPSGGYKVVVHLWNPEDVTRGIVITADDTQFPAVANIVQDIFDTTETKLINWGQGEIEEE